MKELDNISNEKKLILNNLEESNRKVNLLEHQQKSSKGEIKEINKLLEDCQAQKY